MTIFRYYLKKYLNEKYRKMEDFEKKINKKRKTGLKKRDEFSNSFRKDEIV